MRISVRVKLPKLIKVFIIILTVSLLNADDNFADNSEKKNLTNNRALEKSLIFPGWGQIHEKQYFKGVALIAAELISITGAILYNHSGNKNYNKYKSSVTENDAVLYRAETERFDRKRNLFIAAGLSIWVINMADIYLFKKKRGGKGLKVSLKKGTDNEISFDLNYSF